MIHGNLGKIELEHKASVVTYKVPPSYGGYLDLYEDKMKRNEMNTPIDLTKAYELSKKYGDNIRVYPASIELRNGQAYALRSRAVCTVGIGDTIQTARKISLEGTNATKGGGLWNRNDIGSKEHINKSISHMRLLRGNKH
jgi:phosphoribosylamine-glycine ligase